MEKRRAAEERQRPVFRRGPSSEVGQSSTWRSQGASFPSLASFSQSTHSGRWRPSPRQSSNYPQNKEVIGTRPGARHGIHQEKDENFDSVAAVVGTCPDMCPANERAQRERLRDLAVFERLDGNPGKTTSKLAVKKFCRTISKAQLDKADIRPLPVLQESLGYLIKLLHSSDRPFEVVHDFIFDRTRSIRQDISIQNIVNREAVRLYEEMVMFHVVSHQKFLRCGDKPDISSLIHLNMEQLVKVLMTLYDLYSVTNTTSSISKKSAEFYSFYVLLHLGPNNITMGDSLSCWYRKLPLTILQSKEVQFARATLRAFQMGNYVRFFKTLANDASYLQFCLVQPIVDEARAKAVAYVNSSSYKLNPYPLLHLANLTLMKESDLESLCNACGLDVTTDEACHKLLPTKQVGFSLPKMGSKHFGCTTERLRRWEAMLEEPGALLDVDL